MAGVGAVRVTLRLADPAATAGLAQRIAAVARPGDVIALAGDLGSGKTAFARAFIRARSRADEDVPSPTFTLVQTYGGTGAGDGTEPVTIWHFDLYRLEAPGDAVELGIDEAFVDAISLIEWPDRLGALLPARSLVLTLAFDPAGGEDGRIATLAGDGSWRQRLGEVGVV